MSVAVYEMEHSPFCIPVTQALTAAGVPFERIPVSNWNREIVIEATDGAYYQVPVLKHNDRVIAESSPDSQDIARYIDRTFVGGKLFPDHNSALQEILIEHIENEIEALTFKLVDSRYLDTLDPVAKMMTIRHKERKFGIGCVTEWKEQRDQLRANADAFAWPIRSDAEALPVYPGGSPLLRRLFALRSDRQLYLPGLQSTRFRPDRLVPVGAAVGRVSLLTDCCDSCSVSIKPLHPIPLRLR